MDCKCRRWIEGNLITIMSSVRDFECGNLMAVPICKKKSFSPIFCGI